MRYALPPLLVLVACSSDSVTFQGNPPTDDDVSDTGGNQIFGKVCDAIDEDGTCSLYTGLAWDIDIAQQNCVAGTFDAAGWCPPATLGKCTFAVAQPLERVAYYYIGVWYDADEETGVANNCGFGEGSWESAVSSGTR